jgi:tyrosyl-tRNA synthetase
MSKSLGNYIGVQDPPDDMFGKIMSVSDALMWRYYELLSWRPMVEVSALKAVAESGQRNPRDIKFDLGEELVDRFHGAGSGRQARENFIARFQQHQLPDELPEVRVSAWPDGLPLPNLLKEASLVGSTSEARSLLRQGAVRVDGERVQDPEHRFNPGAEHVVQVGKRRIARVRVA